MANKINTQAQAQGFMYGLQALRFKSKIIGYIEKGSFDFGGAKGETVDVEAEQVPDAPVWTLQQSNATIKPKFNLIQLQYENLQMLLGGSLIKEGEGAQAKVVGWAAPVDLEQISGEMQIDTPSGHRIEIPNGMLNGNFSGGLTMDAVAKVECELSVLKPEDGGAPYRIINIPEDAPVE